MENRNPSNPSLLTVRPKGTMTRTGEAFVAFDCRADRGECGKAVGCVALVSAYDLGTPQHVQAMQEQGICDVVLENSGANRLLDQAPTADTITSEV